VLIRPKDAVIFGLRHPAAAVPLCVHSNNTYNLWDPRSFEKLPDHELMPKPEDSHIIMARLSPKGDRQAVMTSDRRLHLWDLKGDFEIATAESQEN